MKSGSWTHTPLGVTNTWTGSWPLGLDMVGRTVLDQPGRGQSSEGGAETRRQSPLSIAVPASLSPSPPRTPIASGAVRLQPGHRPAVGLWVEDSASLRFSLFICEVGTVVDISSGERQAQWASGQSHCGTGLLWPVLVWVWAKLTFPENNLGLLFPNLSLERGHLGVAERPSHQQVGKVGAMVRHQGPASPHRPPTLKGG